MDDLNRKPITFAGGSIMPAAGTEGYRQAQQGVLPTSSYTSPTITSDTLTKPVKAFEVPQTKNTDLPYGQQITSYAQGIANQNQLEQQQLQEANKRKTEQQSVKSAYQSVLEKLGMRGQEQLQAEQDAGLPQKRQDVTRLTNEIAALDLEGRRRIEDLDKTFTGTTQGKADAVRLIQKETDRQKADKAIVLSAAVGDFNALQENINRKIGFETEDLKARRDILKVFYDENKDFLDDETKRLLTKAEKQADREYTDTKEKLKILEDTKLEIYKNLALNNAPLSVYDAVNLASNKEDAKPEDIIAAAGSLGGDVKKQLEIKKLQKEIDDINPQNSVDIKNLPIAGQNLLASVRNLRFATVEESKRIIGNVTRALAKGDVEGATEELRIFGYQKLKGAQQTDYDLYEGAKASADSALSQIADQNISTGPYKTLLENKKPWLSIQRDKEFVDLKSIIELGQAQLRKGFYGTAVTGTEAANARNFLIVDSDDINTIKWKLTNTSAFLQFVNDAIIARNIGMEKPKLDDYLTYVVKDKQTGQLGVIPRSEYNPEAYEITKQ